MIRDKRSFFLILLYAAVLIAGGFGVYRLWSLKHAMAGLDNTALGNFQGSADAPKTIVEFLDYRCSYCRAIDPTMQEVLARNPDVKIVYRHYPVFGKPSVIEAEVALAAGMQGKFAEAHNILITRDNPITDREVEEIAAALGLDMERFRKDLKGPEIGELLLNTMDTTHILKIGATPSFVVGDIVYTMNDGKPTVEMFESLLAEAYGH